MINKFKSKNMKTLKFIERALLAMVLSVSFSACSNDNENIPGDNNDNSSETALKPSKLEWNDGRYFKLSYDPQKRLHRVEEYTESGYLEETATIEYNENTIVVTASFPDMDNRKSIDICSLNSEGFIVKTVSTEIYSNRTEKSNIEKYAYDKEQQLISVQNTTNDTEVFITWENGNIIATSSNDYMNTYNTTYKYTTIPSSKGFFLFYDDMLIDIFHDVDYLSLLANCGYFGKVPQNLLESITITNDSGNADTWGLSYQLGKDGYVTKISGTENNANYSAKLTWN